MLGKWQKYDIERILEDYINNVYHDMEIVCDWRERDADGRDTLVVTLRAVPVDGITGLTDPDELHRRVHAAIFHVQSAFTTYFNVDLVEKVV